jgi:hypothetical protein
MTIDTTISTSEYNVIDCLFPNGFIYTHMNLDLDAVCSIWFARQVLKHPGEYKFVPANWDGEEMGEGDIALDINAGDKGIKGEKDADGVTYSCFRYLLRKYAKGTVGEPATRSFAGSSTVVKALTPLAEFVDAQDAHGSAVKYLVPEAGKKAQEILMSTGLNAVLRAVQAIKGPDDRAVVEFMTPILDGLLKAGVNRIKAEGEADAATIISDKTGIFAGGVAVVRNAKHYATNGILFERGIRAVVFVDGMNLGVCREGGERVRMDAEPVREVVQEAGEEKEWFAHPAGFLYARGTRKAPATTPSKVDPERLALAVRKALVTSGESLSAATANRFGHLK